MEPAPTSIDPDHGPRSPSTTQKVHWGWPWRSRRVNTGAALTTPLAPDVLARRDDCVRALEARLLAPHFVGKLRPHPVASLAQTSDAKIPPTQRPLPL